MLGAAANAPGGLAEAMEAEEDFMSTLPRRAPQTRRLSAAAALQDTAGCLPIPEDASTFRKPLNFCEHLAEFRQHFVQFRNIWLTLSNISSTFSNF